MLDSCNTPRVPNFTVVILTALLLTGCGSSTKIERPSTYVGEMTSAHLADLYLAAPGGQRLEFSEVFKGFEPQSGLLTTALPFRKIAVADIVYEAVLPVAKYYDSNANNNGWLEGPELIVLYIREGAIGLGHSVDYVGVNPRVNALATSAAETGGLMEFVKQNLPGMAAQAQKVFKDIEQIGVDRRNRASGGPGGAGGGGK